MKKVILLSLFVFLYFSAFDVSAQTGRKYKTRKYVAKNAVKTDSDDSKKKANVGTNVPVISQEVIKPLPGINDGGDVKMPKSIKTTLADETLSGNVVVDVSANSNTVIKIGLASRGVALIDFPADDPVYKIHPGNENFVTVNCENREASGRCQNSPTDAIVLRPGKDFHTLGGEEAAATVITIQRVSGIVVTLIVVPVKTLSENTNYVAVRYKLDEVLQSRLKSGLPVKLKPDGRTGNISVSAQTQNMQAQTGETMAGNNKQVVDASLGANNTSPTNDENQNSADQQNEQSLEKVLVDEIQRVAKENPQLKFSKPVYGISLARASNFKSRVKDITVETVAVRNTLPYAVRLVPDQPTLAVENKDAKRAGVSSESVSLLYTATTVEDSEVLEPGRIYYFAFAYQSPILGVKQSLRVSFAQREAADAPATLELSGASR